MDTVARTNSPHTVLSLRTARRVWKNYLPAVNGVVFLVDCADHDRLSESKTELDVRLAPTSCFHAAVPTVNCGLMPIVLMSHFQALLGDETIVNVPVLVLGNKIDRPEAISEGGLRGAFALDGQVTGKVGVSSTPSFDLADATRFLRPGAERALSSFTPICRRQGNVSSKELNARPLEIFMCSVLKKQGYGEGFRWLSQYID